MLFDVTGSSMTNGENPVADGAVSPVHILTDASERLLIIFPYPSVVLQFLQPQSKSRVSMTGDTEHGSHCMDPETSVSLVTYSQSVELLKVIGVFCSTYKRKLFQASHIL